MSEQTGTSEQVIRRLSAVLFADLVDSVRLIQADSEGTVARWRDFVSGASADIKASHGRMVKHTGDGMLVEFESIVECVRCALTLQRRMLQASADLAPDRQLRLRMGAHVADVIVDHIDIYGDGVNLAARLMTLGGPGEIVISSAVRDQLSDGLGVTLEDLGERTLKGMARPVRAFRAWPVGSPPSSGDRRRRTGDRPSIAVLPFRTLPSDPAHDFLGDLLAEDVIGHLSRLTDLFVISRLSTTPFRDRLYEPRNVAEALGVRYVLSGNILVSSGGALQVPAELTEADVGRVVWSERFKGSLTDVFQMHEALARDIARKVVPYVRQLELQRARTKRLESLSAYERTLRAIDHFHRSSRADLEQAKLLLEAAIDSEPAYATAHAWLAHWYVRRVGQGWSEDAARDTAEARRLAATALECDETDSLVLTVNGLVAAYLDKDLEAAIGYFDRALAINPSEASAWVWSTSTYAWMGNGEEAMRRSERAIELSPFDPRMYTFTSIAGTAHVVGGRYDRAIDFCRQSLRLNRMFASTHRILAISLALSGDVEGARGAGTELLQLEPGLTVERFRTRYPGNRSTHIDSFCEALAMAGVPRT